MARKSPFTAPSPRTSRARNGPGAIATATVAELDLDDELAAPPSSYLDARPPHRSRPSLTRRSRTRTKRRGRGRRLRRWAAVPVLALLVVAGLVLTSVIVGLVKVEMNAASGASAASSPLVVPAPTLAGGLPQRHLPTRDATTRKLIAEFIRRFTAVTGSYTGQPGALYREPGTVNLANEQGWVMYLGDNSAASLGSPQVTIGRVVAVLTGTSAPATSWPAAPGPRGGRAKCALTLLGTTTVTLCAWATEHTIGALMSPTADTRGKELAVLMSLMRLDLQPGPSSHHVPGRVFE